MLLKDPEGLQVYVDKPVAVNVVVLPEQMDKTPATVIEGEIPEMVID